jgi:hypothetical protein
MSCTLRNSNQIVKHVAHHATQSRDILGLMTKKSKDPGHPFPVPKWWWVRAGQIRESMTDQAFLDAIRSYTGNSYTKFQVTRYFKESDPSTTLELTRDIWLAFRTSRQLPRPFAIADTPEDAALLESRLRGQVDEAVSGAAVDVAEASSVSRTYPLQSPREKKGTRGKVERDRAGTPRR